MALIGQSPKKKEDQCVQITHFLLQNGADISIQNNDGATPLDLCKNDRIKSTVERLIRDRYTLYDLFCLFVCFCFLLELI